jgi:hypothetical protein
LLRDINWEFAPLCCVSFCVDCLWLFFWSFITNLTFHYLIMEIMQNSFIHNSYVSHTDIMHYKHSWHTVIGRCKICVTFVHS